MYIFHGMEEVRGSIPLSSTKNPQVHAWGFFTFSVSDLARPLKRESIDSDGRCFGLRGGVGQFQGLRTSSPWNRLKSLRSRVTTVIS